MRKNLNVLSNNLSYLILLSFLLVSHPNAFSWGFYAHKKINRMAVFTLPSGMVGFYKKHIEYITAKSTAPDKRRYAIEEEGPRHYINVDYYSKTAPFDSIPERWDKAVEKFTEDTLNAHGIIPWHIDKMVYLLTKAFEREDAEQILKISAELGHYVADAHVPLHSTINYNGQLTGQWGIHGLWESRLPELKAEEYDFFTGKAEYVENPLEFSWKSIEQSYAAVDSVLKFEAQLTASFPEDKKYSYEKRGRKQVKTYSVEYTDAYHTMLNGMVERRIRNSIYAVGCLWYTAWVNAGKPDLENLKELEWKADTVDVEEKMNLLEDHSHGR